MQYHIKPFTKAALTLNPNNQLLNQNTTLFLNYTSSSSQMEVIQEAQTSHA